MEGVSAKLVEDVTKGKYKFSLGTGVSKLLVGDDALTCLSSECPNPMNRTNNIDKVIEKTAMGFTLKTMKTKRFDLIFDIQ
jgi:hypothetical protein